MRSLGCAVDAVKAEGKHSVFCQKEKRRMLAINLQNADEQPQCRGPGQDAANVWWP